MSQIKFIKKYHSIDELCLLELKKYKKNSIKTFVENVNNKENSYKLDKFKNVSNKIYTTWDKITNHNDSVKSSVYKGYISNTNGHWVTIDGNHVFIED